MTKYFELKPLNLAISTAIVISAIGLSACGGDDGNGNDLTTDTNITPDTNTTPIKQEMGSYSLVKAGSDDNFVNYYSSALSDTPNQPQPEANVGSDVLVADNAVDAGKGKNISTTNLIEAGVDEVDYVKQDATHIYTAKNSYGDKTNDTINIFAKPSTDAIASLDLGNSVGIKGFFLKNDNLYNFRQLSYGANNWYDKNINGYKNGIIALETIDVSNPSSPSIDNTYKWQGNYVDSRRINDKVYVVSSSTINDPWMCYDVMPDVMPVEPTLGDQLSNADIATNMMPYCGEPKELTTEDIIERMPVDINGTKVSPSDCFIPNEYNKESDNLNLNITLITEVDLTGDNHKTTCISASAESFYMSPNALYLAGHDYTNSEGDYQERTILNKFSLNSDEVSYAGSGAVDGHINWDTASFSMSEYDDVLRVVTSTWKDGGIYNMLHTLKESDTALTLEPLATIPNDSQPASLGKPNERIKGIRFLGDEGYVVTFETKDPLYKIDLSDPSNPQIVGELEMPGYSAYLHRINDKYLLGVGYTTNEQTRADGVQVTVFDTSGDNPVIVDQDTIKVADSDLLSLAVAEDSRAITTLTHDNTMQLSIPYSIIVYNPVYQRANKAVEYDIDLNTGLLTSKTKRVNAVKKDNYGQNIVRSLISNDDIYYAIDGSLQKYMWGTE